MNYKPTDAALAAAALPAEVQQQLSQQQQLKFLCLYLLGPLHLFGPSSAFLPYIFFGVKKAQPSVAAAATGEATSFVHIPSPKGTKAELGVGRGGSLIGPKKALLTSYVFTAILSLMKHVKTVNGRYLPKE